MNYRASSRQRTIVSTILVCVLLLIVFLFANATAIWAAPSSQGTVPPPPEETPVPPTPMVAPFLTGACCLPGVAFQSNRD